MVAARRVSRRPDAEAGDPPRHHRKGCRAWRSSGAADLCARQRDSARRRPVARPHARRAFPAGSLRRREERVAGEPVHLRQFPADRIPRPLLLRHLCVQRLPAPRAGASRVPRAAAAHRRPAAAAARRGGRRQHPRGRGRAGRHHRDAHSRRLRRRGVRRNRIRLDRRVVARRARGRGLEVRPRRSRSPAEAGGGRRRGGVRRRAVLARAAASMAEGVGRRLRVRRRGHARGQPPLARGADLPGLRDHPRQRRLEGSHARDREELRQGARDRHAERRAERRAQCRPGRGGRRDRRVHRRRHARRSRLAHVPRPAVSHLRRRRIGRTERRAARRCTDGAVHRARARRTDPRAPRRSHRRARARLQHGVPPRRTARDRRLQPHLPPRGRRCGCVLAAAVARLEDRLRLVRAGVAPPSIVGERLLAAAGRLRRGRDLADGASPGKIPRRLHAVARANLQPAAVRPIDVGNENQRRRLGHRAVSIRIPHRRAPVRVPAALDQVAGRLVRAHVLRRGRRRSRATPLGCLSAARHRPHRCRRDDREEHRVRDAIAGRCAPRQHALVPRRRRVPAFPPAARPPARADPRRAVAARGRAAAGRAADEPRTAAVARRGLARARPHLRQRHRGSLLERDLDVGRSPAVAADRLAAPLARRPHDRDR